eukprot:g40332.t1
MEKVDCTVNGMVIALLNFNRARMFHEAVVIRNAFGCVTKPVIVAILERIIVFQASASDSVARWQHWFDCHTAAWASVVVQRAAHFRQGLGAPCVLRGSIGLKATFIAKDLVGDATEATSQFRSSSNTGITHSVLLNRRVAQAMEGSICDRLHGQHFIHVVTVIHIC